MSPNRLPIEYEHGYVPIFCPNCGTNCNEPDDSLGVDRKSSVNCYWCKRRHSIEQVKICRALGHLNEKQQMESARAGLLLLRERLTKADDDGGLHDGLHAASGTGG